jgi:hypothetical protein
VRTHKKQNKKEDLLTKVLSWLNVFKVEIPSDVLEHGGEVGTKVFAFLVSPGLHLDGVSFGDPDASCIGVDSSRDSEVAFAELCIALGDELVGLLEGAELQRGRRVDGVVFEAGQHGVEKGEIGGP